MNSGVEKITWIFRTWKFTCFNYHVHSILGAANWNRRVRGRGRTGRSGSWLAGGKRLSDHVCAGNPQGQMVSECQGFPIFGRQNEYVHPLSMIYTRYSCGEIWEHLHRTEKRPRPEVAQVVFCHQRYKKTTASLELFELQNADKRLETSGTM